MTKRFSFWVEFDVPAKAGVRTCVDYIKTALQSERGNLPPESVMSDFNRDSIKVRRIIEGAV